MPSFVLRKSLIKPRGPLIAEPESVHRGAPPDDAFTLEMVPRNCRLEEYTPVIPSHRPRNLQLVA